MKLYFTSVAWQLLIIHFIRADDNDYNVVRPDGSFHFGYSNPDSYHYADGTRNNVVGGEFGARNPKNGGVDTTVYTAGPRGYRPRGKNVYRKYDLNQNGPRPIGTSHDPYADPLEDPSYNFAFKTKTYSREENANRIGDVIGKYTYLDDVGERHNVEFIAGEKTGFHIKTPFPDSNSRSYGPLYFRGRGRQIPRGRTSIQRGLDGSYKFVSAGPDQRRTEVSDSTGHVRGSYTYLDDKGIQHSVHYIAGPETGYRVLKTVKGVHLPAAFPFETPDIVPSDFYGYGTEGDTFDTAASDLPYKPGRRPIHKKPTTDLGNSIDIINGDIHRYGGESKQPFSSSTSRPGLTMPRTMKPQETHTKETPAFDDGISESDDEDFGDDLFGGSGTVANTQNLELRPTIAPTSSTGRPTITTFKPNKSSWQREDADNGSYKPDGSDDGSYRPTSDELTRNGISEGSSINLKPGSSSSVFPGYASSSSTSGPTFDDDYTYFEKADTSLFGSEDERPLVNRNSNEKGGADGVDYEEGSSAKSAILQIQGRKKSCRKCSGTVLRNIGYKPLHVPPGVSVRANVQSIDLYPAKSASPSDFFNSET